MKQKDLRRAIDIGMTVLLLLQMAYQVMGEAAHEWLGMGMTALVIVHQILNRRWYGAAFKGKYSAWRAVSTCVNALLLVSFALTAFCGMAMSNYAVPFLYGIARVSFVRVTHLSMSHWSFVLMGLHLGLHVPMMLAGLNDRARRALSVAGAAVAGVGLWLFLKNGMPNYLFFRVPFAFLDYEKAGALVLLENVAMLLFWAYAGWQIALALRGRKGGNPLAPVALVLAAVAMGGILNMIWPNRNDSGFDSGWGSAAEAPWQAAGPEANPEAAPLDDGFVLVEGGAFRIGSPEDENWRIDDETPYEVTLASFYIAPYETTQAEWEAVMGSNPSTFTGENLPVENISWLDAVRYANARSEAAGLTPVYAIDGESVTWDRAADGYRLPTEAEWEYACRAGTATPFNLERSLDADDANFYGYYPYEIEENYFDDSVLEARPEIAGHVDDMAAYDTVLLGYPNWWASIPMPIASFLEQYDFAGKRIVPFCSHGGGRFGQSLTAIAKLAPEANMGEGLSVHYSGGSTLSEDVAEWLQANRLGPEA